MEQQAFILRISPSRIDRVQDALKDEQLIIGWSKAKGLLNDKLTWGKFRKIISETYYKSEYNLRKAGSASGNMWRFIREMNEGDLVVVPHGSEFYLAKVTGSATHNDSNIDDDTAYRRQVNWLNNKKAIPRKFAKAALISRMKNQGTCARATDLLPEIIDCLELAKEGAKPTFQEDLKLRLVDETIDEIRNGRMDDRRFETLIKDILIGLGAVEARIIPRRDDKGADNRCHLYYSRYISKGIGCTSQTLEALSASKKNCG